MVDKFCMRLSRLKRRMRQKFKVLWTNSPPFEEDARYLRTGYQNLSTFRLEVDNFIVNHALNTQARIRALAEEDRLLRPSDVEGLPDALAQAERSGTVHRVIAGVYIGAQHRRHPLIESAAWTLRHPRAVACLLTAAVYHDLTTAFARGTWLFVPKGSTPPRSRTGEVHVIQTNERFIDPEHDDDNGIVTVQVHGVAVRITGPDRTVLDLLRYPRRVSVEHALEALRRRSLARDFHVPGFARLARRLGAWGKIEALLQGMMLR